MAMSKLQTLSWNYKGVRQESLNSSPYIWKWVQKPYTIFLFILFNYKDRFLSLPLALLWVAYTSPITTPVAAVLPPGHTWGNAVVCVLCWDGTSASRVTWPTCHFALLYEFTCCSPSFLGCTSVAFCATESLGVELLFLPDVLHVGFFSSRFLSVAFRPYF